jgi:hypothetical protein
MVIVESLGTTTRRLVRQEIRQRHSAEPAALYPAADEQPAQAILRRAGLARVRLARRA